MTTPRAIPTPAGRGLTALLLFFLFTGAAAAQEQTPDLPIGDPARRDRHVPVVLDGVTDTSTGDVITPSDLAARLDPVRLLFIGEAHTTQAYHDVQLRVLQELQKRGRRVHLAVEMYPYTQQSWLDAWSAGSLDEDTFLVQSGWYRYWGYHWNYYRDIFRFARDHRMPVHAVNVPRHVVQIARSDGLDAVGPDDRAYLPPRIDFDNDEHRQLLRAYLGGSQHTTSMTDTQWDGLLRAQTTWDAAMGYGAVKALQADPDPTSIAVVLIGAGHVAYGLGAERQARLWFDGRSASIIPVLAHDTRGRPAPAVRASYADFVWGIPAEIAPRYPVTGLSTGVQKDGGFYRVVAVARNSSADAAGMKTGDLLLALDDEPIDETETLNRLLAAKRWGDTAVFRVRRDAEDLTIRVVLRRTLPEPASGTAAAPSSASDRK